VALTEADAIRLCRPSVRALAKALARAFRSAGADFDDLMQEGELAVARAFQTWNPDGGAGIVTWAWPMARGAMLHVCRVLRGQGMKWSPKASVVVIDSMDAPLEFNDSVHRTLHDKIGAFEEPPDYFARKRLAGAVSALAERERVVIRARFVDDLTLEQTGALLGVTKERARQIEADALVRLRLFLKVSKHNAD